MENRFYHGLMYGAVIGDALGVPYEFEERGTFEANDMIGYGTYDQPEGTWSDDTSLTLITIEALKDDKPFHKTMELMLKYKESGYMTPFGEMFDIGNTCRLAIDRYIHDRNNPFQGIDHVQENGNGSLMRIHPILFTENYYKKTIEEKFITVNQHTRVTHGHHCSIYINLIYLEILLNIAKGLSKEESVRKALDDVKNSENFLSKGIELAIFYDVLNNIGNEPIISRVFSGGYAVHTLQGAIWSFLNGSDYKDVVLKAVNLGDDTDTVGTIAGALAGAYYKELPEEWFEKLQNKKLLEEVIDDFKYTNNVLEFKDNYQSQLKDLVSDWILEPGFSYRYLLGRDKEIPSNRVCAIEKTPRVQVKDTYINHGGLYITDKNNNNVGNNDVDGVWIYGLKGDGPKDEESMNWCDGILESIYGFKWS